MTQVKVHALVLDTNIAGQIAHFKIAIQGVEFSNKKIPENYPKTSIHEIAEFTHWINRLTQDTIARITRGKNICIFLYKEDECWDIERICIENDSTQNLFSSLNKLCKI